MKILGIKCEITKWEIIIGEIIKWEIIQWKIIIWARAIVKQETVEKKIPTTESWRATVKILEIRENIGNNIKGKMLEIRGNSPELCCVGTAPIIRVGFSKIGFKRLNALACQCSPQL